MPGPVRRLPGLKPRLSLDRVSASVHACRKCSFEGVDTLLVRGSCLRFLLLLLLRSGLCCLLLGRFVSLPLLCSTQDRKSTRLNSSHTVISYAVFCLKKKKL